jgi:hypothetical protein
MSKPGFLKLALLPLAAAMCLAASGPTSAMAHKPDCWKVPGHPDCLYPPYPGYRNSDLTAHGRKAPSVPPPELASPWPTTQQQQQQR